MVENTVSIFTVSVEKVSRLNRLVVNESFSEQAVSTPIYIIRYKKIRFIMKIKRISFGFIAFLLAEIALQQTSKACTVASLVLSHFVNGVVDGIEAGSLGVLGNAELVFASTSLSSSTLL